MYPSSHETLTLEPDVNLDVVFPWNSKWPWDVVKLGHAIDPERKNNKFSAAAML
jgi:hypothetical protein